MISWIKSALLERSISIYNKFFIFIYSQCIFSTLTLIFIGAMISKLILDAHSHIFFMSRSS